MELKKYFSKNRFSLRQVVGMLTAVIVGVSVLAYATVTIPYTFTAGTTASSSEVNANFTALANAINNRTPATLANMAGTYNFTQFGAVFNGSPPAALLCTGASRGTVTLNADGTFSLVRGDVIKTCVSSAGTSFSTDFGGTMPGTWTVLADGSGTYTFNGNTYFFQASRDLNTIVVTRDFDHSYTFVRQ